MSTYRVLSTVKGPAFYIDRDPDGRWRLGHEASEPWPRPCLGPVEMRELVELAGAILREADRSAQKP